MIEILGMKLDLKTFTREEYHALYKEYVADPIMDPNLYIYDEERVNKRYELIASREGWYQVLGIFLKDKTPIGDIQVKRINYEKSQCELGIILANNTYKGYGYGTEAIQMTIDYIFNNLKLEYIYADTMGTNVIMQRIFDKLAFHYIDKIEHCYDMQDRWEDKLNYVLKNPNYEK